MSVEIEYVQPSKGSVPITFVPRMNNKILIIT